MTCLVCHHPHAEDLEETCVSCGCDAPWLTDALLTGDPEWVQDMMVAWLGEPGFIAMRTLIEEKK